MKITFIGLGSMGTAMVERLLLKNYVVTVFNRTIEKANALVALGALASESIDQAVAQADIVLTCLLDDNAVLDITHAMLSNLKQNAIHIGLSTVLPDTAETLQQLHRKTSTHYISATVLGVPSVARAGKLTTFCAGGEDCLKIAVPLLLAFSENVVPLGNEADIKAPNLMKICMNYSLMTAIELISELYVFAEKSGLDKEIVKKGLHNIYGHPAFKRYIDKIADRDFDHVNFSMAGGNKDAGIFQKAFLQADIVPELGNIMKARFQDALSSGMENKDWSGIYEVVRTKAGLVN